MSEWHQNYPDWSKEKRCTECRSPAAKRIDIDGDLVWVTCRNCKHVVIKICEECGEEMGLCTYYHPKYNSPPDKEWHLDKKRLCAFHGE